jgi:class 3 adenylate cyclase
LNGSKQHADALAQLALDMVDAAQKVESPLDGKPLQVLIGLHSGDIYAGIGV